MMNVVEGIAVHDRAGRPRQYQKIYVNLLFRSYLDVTYTYNVLIYVERLVIVKPYSSKYCPRVASTDQSMTGLGKNCLVEMWPVRFTAPNMFQALSASALHRKSIPQPCYFFQHVRNNLFMSRIKS